MLSPHVSTAPREAVAEALDLCCGGGIQGLVAAAHYAGQVVAVDVNPRAIRFARANAQLNGLENYQAVQGDLYAPVEGRRFDLILANPPFVPSPETDLGFRDGGANGEAILARIVAGAEAHLNPGGRVAIVTDLVDPSTLDGRLDRWWGEAFADRLVLTTAPRDEILFSEPHARRPFDQSMTDYEVDLDRWVTNFRQSGLVAVDFGYILIWRRAQGTPHTTTRVVSSPTTPVHGQVSAWKRSMDQFQGAGAQAVVPVPGLAVEQTRDALGRFESARLTVPGNPFFTTYAVDEATVETIGAVTAGERSDDPVVGQLVRLGLLRTTSGGTVVALSPARRAKKPLNGEAQPARKPGIRRVTQSLTKTTPTCLSSYLC